MANTKSVVYDECVTNPYANIALSSCMGGLMHVQTRYTVTLDTTAAHKILIEEDSAIGAGFGIV